MTTTMRILHREREIARRVQRLGNEINEHYTAIGGPLVLLGVLKGAFIFLADLAREISFPFEVAFTQASHPGAGTAAATGRVDVFFSPEPGAFDGKHVLIVEDIIASGRTVNRIIGALSRWHKPKSIELCVLLNASTEITPRFQGYDAPSEFVVGYGMDVDELHRGWPYLAVQTEQ